MEHEKNKAEAVKQQFKNDIVQQMEVSSIQRKYKIMTAVKEKEAVLEAANANALVRDWEESEKKAELKTRLSK